jgi:glycosyltransferase involved in cell wall biosynthesis
MRVLIVAPWGQALGGAETMLLNLLDHADAAQVSFHVAFLEDGPFVREAAERGAATHVIPSGRLRHLGRFRRTVSQLAELIDSIAPDVVTAWSPKMHLYVSPAVARAKRAPAVAWWQHGVPGRQLLYRFVTLLPTAAVGCSSETSARAQERLWPRRPTFVVHPGIEPVAAHPRARAEIRRELGIPEDAMVVGIVGRLQPLKRQDRFVRAIEQVRRERPDVFGLIVGGDAYGLSPKYAGDVVDLVDDLGLGDFVRITGQVDDVSPYLSAMDVFINASEQEAFGIAVIEAMASGLPVVAVAEGGPLEIVAPGATGILVPTSAPLDLARGLTQVLDDPVERDRLARGGREAFLERFSAVAMADRFGREIRALAHG